MAEQNLVTDLFGDVVTLPTGRRGRPAHRWTKENADRVILGLAMGYSTAEIANGLHVSEPTLRKYYFSELKAREMQRTRFELWQAHKLAELANEGNVAAMKELDRLKRRRDQYLTAASLRNQEAAPAPEKIGKKEAARRAAQETADGGGVEGWGGLLKPGDYH